jgi:hypothetical protein
MDGDIIYIRHIWTNSVKYVLEGLTAGEVLRLTAHRSYGNVFNTSRPHHWASIKESNVVLTQIDFLSLHHGQFDTVALMQLLDNPKIEDAPAHELDIYIGKGPIGKAFAEMRRDKDFEDKGYVAHFEEYPIRREPEENKFTADAREKFEDYDLGRLGFEVATLDLKYVLPLANWKEVVRGHLSQEYQAQLKAFKVDFLRLANSEVRRLALSVLSKDICSAREYKRLKGDVWTLVRSGDI